MKPGVADPFNAFETLVGNGRLLAAATIARGGRGARLLDFCVSALSTAPGGYARQATSPVMITIGLTAVVLILAAIPALLFHANLRAYRPPPRGCSATCRRDADGPGAIRC